MSMAQSGHAQKHDYIWLNGWDAEFGGVFGNFIMDFHQEPVGLPAVDFGSAVFINIESSVSDIEGNLLYAAEGCRIYNAQGEVIPGAEVINPGEIHSAYCNNGNYPSVMAMIPIPIGNSTIMYFHYGIEFDNKFTIALRPSYQTLLRNNEILAINQQVNYFHSEGMAAVRHGNGRDWWVIQSERSTNNFKKQLFNDKGEFQVWEQSIGYHYPFPQCESFGIHSFSPDGTRFVRFNNSCGLSFFDFDRCTGELSNERRITLPHVYYPGAYTVFSPNSRYCYYNSNRVILQVDMEAPILLPDTVAIVDSFPADFGSGFSAMQRGPDGRIYIGTGSSNKARHLIHYPDVKGPDCWVEPSGLPTPFLTRPLPNIPNYRLKGMAGSPCDTLGLSGIGAVEVGELKHRIFPNPISDGFTLELDEGLSHPLSWLMTVYDPLGRIQYEGVIPAFAYLHRVESASWPAGMYHYTLRNEQQHIIGSGRVIKE